MPWVCHKDGTAILDHAYRRPGPGGTTIPTHHRKKTDIPFGDTARVARAYGAWVQQFEGSLTCKRTSDLIAHYRADHERVRGLETYLAGLDGRMGSVRLDRRWAERWAVCIARLRTEPFKAHGWKQAKRRSASTVGKYAAVMRAVLKYAVATGWLDRLPVTAWAVPVAPGRQRVLDRDEEMRLLNALVGDWLYWPVRFALRNPVRREDLFRLTTEQFDVTVPWVRFWPRKTQASQKRPTCLACLDEDLVHYLASRPAGAVLFPKPGREFKRHWATVCVDAGLQDFRFHDLRHCATRYMLDQGYTTDELRRLAIHGTAQMVARYDQADQREVIGRLRSRSISVASGRAAAA